jgi:endonuclease YncB( thermonuclease family)
MSAPAPAHVYPADVLDVHDGDTYRLRVDLGFRVAVTIDCRLHGVDAPELELDGRPNLPGIAARQFVVAVFTQAHGTQPLTIASYKDARSFARWVCDVWLGDGRSLADVLIDAGHAVPYRKGTP